MDLLQNIRRLKEIKKQLSIQNQNQNPQQKNSNSQGANNPALTTNQANNTSISNHKQGDIIGSEENLQNIKYTQIIKNEQSKILEQKKGQTQLNSRLQKQQKQCIQGQQQKTIPKSTQISQQNSIQKQDQATTQQVRQLKPLEGGLFRGLVFCFPIYNIELTQNRAKAIRKTIQKLEGVVYDLQELEEIIDQCDQQEDAPSFSLDFMLVDPSIPRETVEAEIPTQIKYRGLLDFKYIFHCKEKNKILDYSLYLLPQRSKQLQNYMKIKEAKKIQQMQNQRNQKWQIKYAVGIEPIDQKNQRRYEPSKADINSNNKQHKTEQTKPAQKAKKSYNKFIVQSFQKLGQLFEKTDRGRYFAYARIAGVLKSIPFQIYCQQDADKLNHKKLRFIGPKTIQKIKQFIRNGSIQRLNALQGKQENLVCQKLQKVWGIGKVRAQELYNRGIKSVEELRLAVQKQEVTLTKNQMIGLKYFEDLNQRIPRDKVTRMFEHIKKVLFEIVGSETQHKVQVCGSYRRGIQTCGDIDVIITNKNGVFEARLINNLVEQLTNQGFLTDHLAMPRHIDPKSCISYMGICKFEDQTHHRVDFKYYPVDQYAYAILYFTGSDMFNRSMRFYAMKNGFCLSDHGMCKAEKIAGNIINQGPNIPCYTEQQIFQTLGIKYKTPYERSI